MVCNFWICCWIQLAKILLRNFASIFIKDIGPIVFFFGVISSPPVWMPFISLLCLIAVARTSKTMLKSSDESGHPYLVPDLSEKAFSFSPLSIIFAVVLS